MHKLTIIALLTLPVAENLRANPPLEQVVVSASRTEQTIADVGSNIAFVDNIEEIGAAHINEAMQRVSGTWVSRGNGQESLLAIRSPVLTGAGGCGAFLTAQDGIPLRASGFCNVNELFDTNSEQAGRIEVIKGPSTVMYGSNAMHGMVNIITPAFDGSRALSAEAGPHDYYRLKLTAGSEQWRVDVNGTSDGGYKDDSGFDQQKATLKHQGQVAGFDATTVFSWTNLNQETAGFIQGTDAYKDSHAVKQNPNPEAYRDSETLRLYSVLRKQLASSEMVLTPYLRRTRMEFMQHFLPGQAIETNGHGSLGLQSAWYFDNWTIGADIEFTDGFLEETQPNPTDSPSAFLVATIPQGDHYDYDVDARSLAAFIQYTNDITDVTRLTIGARFEQVKYDYNNNMLTGRTDDQGMPCGFGGCRFSRPADRSDTFNNLSPRLSVTHYFSSATQMYFQLSQGFRAPQATELYRLQGGQTVSAIDSEELSSIEWGIRGGLASIGYDLSVFAMEKDNFIFRDSNRATVDNGETSHRGIELSIVYPFAENWTGELVATYARHQYENNPALSATPVKGNDIDTAPRQLGSARLSWQPRPNISTELEWVYLGEYYTDPANLHKYDGHSLVNLRLNFDITSNINTFFRIINLTDTEYAERADFGFGNDRYFVGEPRSVYAGIRASF
ncbi:MAG: TonB-dependent receptor [bacterium]|nr:TonB-dependent receptor [Gammaproteobacteria bacterium]HIL97007.1 TonB-dependent receptor [Pseudomonadales bacterium]